MPTFFRVMEASFRRRFTLKLHLGLPKTSERALILKHMLRKFFCLITDDEYERLGVLADGFSGGDMEVAIGQVFDWKESQRIEAGTVQECPIRSSPYQPVWVPCGPYGEKPIKMSPMSCALLGDCVEITPIIFTEVKKAIMAHTKTVPERLASYHVDYSKNNDFKPPERTQTITHLHQDLKK